MLWVDGSITDVHEATSYAEDLLEFMEDELTELQWEKNLEFLESVQDKIKSILDTMERQRHVTSTQAKTLRSYRSLLVDDVANREYDDGR